MGSRLIQGSGGWGGRGIRGSPAQLLNSLGLPTSALDLHENKNERSSRLSPTISFETCLAAFHVLSASEFTGGIAESPIKGTNVDFTEADRKVLCSNPGPFTFRQGDFRQAYEPRSTTINLHNGKNAVYPKELLRSFKKRNSPAQRPTNNLPSSVSSLFEFDFVTKSFHATQTHILCFQTHSGNVFVI